VRGTAGLDADDPVGRQRFALHEELHVLGVKMSLVMTPAGSDRASSAQRIDERGFP
jgi:hypothetical protein